MTRSIRKTWAIFSLCVLTVTIAVAREPAPAAADAGKTLTGQRSAGRLDHRRPRSSSQDHACRPGEAVRDPFGQQLPARGQKARRGVAQGPRGLRGHPVRDRSVRAARDRARAQWRPVPGREPCQSRARLPRRRRRRQARGQPGIRHRVVAAVRDRILSRRSRANPSLCRQHRVGRALPLSQRRREGDRQRRR